MTAVGTSYKGQESYGGIAAGGEGEMMLHEVRSVHYRLGRKKTEPARQKGVLKALKEPGHRGRKTVLWRQGGGDLYAAVQETLDIRGEG